MTLHISLLVCILTLSLSDTTQPPVNPEQNRFYVVFLAIYFHLLFLSSFFSRYVKDRLTVMVLQCLSTHLTLSLFDVTFISLSSTFLVQYKRPNGTIFNSSKASRLCHDNFFSSWQLSFSLLRYCTTDITCSLICDISPFSLYATV